MPRTKPLRSCWIYRALRSIRVKIFPHDRDYKPQGLDPVKDHIQVESDQACTQYAGSSERAVSSGPILQRAKTFSFRAQELQQPAYLVCPAGFRLIRQGVPAQQSYRYKGRLYVRAVAGQLEAINIVGLEEYLRGVVPSEVYREWPMETLKTQAVAARTYAVYHLVFSRRYNADRLWDVDDTINFQAYTGVEQHGPRTDEAVKQTEGEILTYQGQVIQAYYHADSGGQTEEALAVWNQSVPFAVSRSEASDLELSPSAWERRLSLAELDRDFKAMGWLEKDQTLRQIVVPTVGRTPTGRVRSLTLIDQKGRAKLVPFSVFRRAANSLPSQLFAIERDPKQTSQILIKGLGNGHGVGMSQMGAAALAAKRAWSYRQILDYYYVRTTLCTLGDPGANGLPNCREESSRFAAERSELGSSG
jgi:SpoIID/LytB domain protein